MLHFNFFPTTFEGWGELSKDWELTPYWGHMQKGWGPWTDGKMFENLPHKFVIENLPHESEIKVEFFKTTSQLLWQTFLVQKHHHSQILRPFLSHDKHTWWMKHARKARRCDSNLQSETINVWPSDPLTWVGAIASKKLTAPTPTLLPR